MNKEVIRTPEYPLLTLSKFQYYVLTFFQIFLCEFYPPPSRIRHHGMEIRPAPKSVTASGY